MIARETEIESLMNQHGWDRDEAELVVDARLARLAAGESRGQATEASTIPVVPPAASFACDPCECGGQCDQCKGGEK